MYEPFLRVPIRIIGAKSLTNIETGVTIKLSMSCKVLLCYLYEKYNFFVVKQHKEFYENQESIAERLSINRRTVVSLISDLVSVGAIAIHKKRLVGARFSNNYVVSDIFNKGIFSMTYSAARGKAGNVNSITQDEEDNLCPF